MALCRWGRVASIPLRTLRGALNIGSALGRTEGGRNIDRGSLMVGATGIRSRESV